jgi:DeoR/GlpR family transcriptional regulator of sugar metabolism
LEQPLPAVRQQRILELLHERGAVRVSTLAERLGVSEVTVRRDLEELERRGLLERTHGGAIPARRIAREPAYVEAVSSHPGQKRRIGSAAARMIGAGETVFLNGGTTTLEVLRHVDAPGARIVTNHVGAALEAADLDVELLLIGGDYRSPSNSCVGDFATQALRRIFAGRSFIGVEGVSLRSGLTTPAAPEAEIARVMIEQTRGPVIVVADSSKVGTVAEFSVAPLDVATTLVTDDGIDEDYRGDLVSAGVEVVIADTVELIVGDATVGVGRGEG